MIAHVFPGQGAQFSGMGKDLYENHSFAKEIFDSANEILGFDIKSIMFEGSDEDLKQTKVTQPAVFLHSVAISLTAGHDQPAMVAGHSLGEFSALVAAGAMGYDDGLRLVSIRAQAMQKACEKQPSTMAAIIGLDDHVVEEVCQSIDDIVVPANYNCPGQLVISGSVPAVEKACEILTEKGARRALMLPVGGAFHSPLMEPARQELEAAIDEVNFLAPVCPIYQNVSAKPVTDPQEIKQNLKAQLTGSVRWTQSVQQMIDDGATQFAELGPGKALSGMIKKINREVEILS